MKRELLLKIFALLCVSAMLVSLFGCFSKPKKRDDADDPKKEQTDDKKDEKEDEEKKDDDGKKEGENEGEKDDDSKKEGENEGEGGKKEDVVLSLIACGDNIVHGTFQNDAVEKSSSTNPDYSYAYRYIESFIKGKDIAYINQETLIGGDEYGFSGYPNFNTPTAMGDLLMKMGFNVFNIAHNHMLDAPSPDRSLYLRNCNSFFTEAGKTAIGYYSSQEDTSNIKIMEVKGVKIAWLAYTYDDNCAYDQDGDKKVTEADIKICETFDYSKFSANGHKIGATSGTYIPYLKKALIEKQVALAKQQADVVLVSAHWGIEDSWSSTDLAFPLHAMQTYYAQIFADCGVDAVIGMHPHVIQKTDWVTGKNGNKMLVAYSLGNLISGMYWGRNMLGAMLEMNIRISGADGSVTVEEPKMIPTVCHYVNKGGEKFREFMIYPLTMYTEELAAAHGCHKKDDTIAKRGKKFSREALLDKVRKTYSSEFLYEDWDKLAA